MPKVFRVLAIIACVGLLWVQPFAVRGAAAQSLLRDAEAEWFFREITTPILLAAGLEPSAVNIYLINDKSLNAFVSGGQNIFLHSGLILAADNVNELLGVIAHETGHISGGHLSRHSDNIKGATAISILSLVLGTAAIIAGSPDAGIGIIGGGQQAAIRNFLRYSRVQEASADQAAATFLEESSVSGRGLISFFDKLRDQEYLLSINQDPYVRGHPLTGDRIARLESRMELSPFLDKPPDAVHEYWFQRIKAKLAGYLHQPHVTLQIYPPSNTSIPARYARVYAYNKALEWDKALAEADSLIAEQPNDPFFLEIKGQILFENGRVEDSIPVFEQAIAIAPGQALILTAYGHALASPEKPEYDQRARQILEKAVSLDRENPFAWYQLAIVYARMDDVALADLATAERHSLFGQLPQAAHYAKSALDKLDEGTPQWVRAQDILLFARADIEEKGGRKRKR